VHSAIPKLAASIKPSGVPTLALVDQVACYNGTGCTALSVTEAPPNSKTTTTKRSGK
jgi:hypothetical protein